MLYPQLNECRNLASLDGCWDLRFEHAGDDTRTWSAGFAPHKQVAVPSSFNDLYPTYAERNHWGHVWYQRTFHRPEAWRGQRVVLRFAAAWYSAEVFLNGGQLGAHETGHTPFEFDVTDRLQAGTNRVVVRLNTRLSPETVPQGEINMKDLPWQVVKNHPDGNFDFFPYAGLHQPVSLYTTNTTRLESVRVDTEDAGPDAHARFHLEIAGTPGRVRVTIEETGETAEGAAGEGTAELGILLRAPRRWDVGQPNLYTARIELLQQDRVVDLYRQTFGVRTVQIRDGRLLLNGRPVYLTGFGKHEDFAVIGRGLNEAVNIRDFELMRWIHANSFRTSHYPYAEETLALADRYGILVISESPAVSIWTDQATPRTLATHCQATREFMRRDYNHPCVIAWCMGNECSTHQPSARPYFEQVCAAAREVDSRRPLMLVTCMGTRDTCLDLVDLVGVNMYPGWYGGGKELDEDTRWVEDFLRSMVEKAGGRPVMVTEFGADSIAGFHSLPAELWTEDYQRDLVEKVLNRIRAVPGVVGEHLWNFADFRTGQNHTRAWGNRKGVFTRDRQPKMVAHLLRERWAQS